MKSHIYNVLISNKTDKKSVVIIRFMTMITQILQLVIKMDFSLQCGDFCDNISNGNSFVSYYFRLLYLMYKRRAFLCQKNLQKLL